MRTQITLLLAALVVVVMTTPTLANHWDPSVSLGGKLVGLEAQK